MRIMLMAFALWLCMPLYASAGDWVKSGWQHLASGHDHQALSIWQQGVNQLPDQRLLPSIGVYAHFPYAIAQLKQVGLSYGSFIIRRQQKGRMLYYVLSTRHIPAQRSQRHLLLADLKKAANITDTLLAIEAKTLKLQSVPTEDSAGIGAMSVRETVPTTAVIMATAANNFSINRFEISGNHHLSTDVILMSLSDFYGAGKTRSDLKSIRNQIMETYRTAKIHDVRIAMPQLINDDTVHIAIEEKN